MRPPVFAEPCNWSPRNVDALNGLALALVELDQADEAMAYCQRAIELEPDNAEALNYRGLALEKQNLLDQAEACYRQALTLKPEYIEAIHNLGVAQSSSPGSPIRSPASGKPWR